MDTHGQVIGQARIWPPTGERSQHGLILAPSIAMDADLRAVHDLLELLDDAVFAAIEGDADSGRQARELWQRAVASLRGELLEESREHFLRFATEALRRTGPDGMREATRALAASEMIEMLTSGGDF